MAVTSETALTVFAWGNESRGDDAIGAIIAGRLAGLDDPRIDILEDHQLNIEHVMDMQAHTPVLFIDASVAIDSDFRLERLVARVDRSMSTHAVSPQALLSLCQQTRGIEVPDAFMLHVRGTSFELGDGISDAARMAVDSAWAMLSSVLRGTPRNWQAALAGASGKDPVTRQTNWSDQRFQPDPETRMA